MNTASVVLVRYREPNSLFHPGIIALGKQQNVILEVLVFDQMKDKETAELCARCSNENITLKFIPYEERGISHIRNVGAKMAQYNKVLLLDGDGIPAENWGQEMTKALDEPQVAIVGSKIVPLWLGRPNFLTKSSVVLEQYAMHDLGKKDKYCKKAIGVSYGFDKEKLGNMEYFDEKLSRRRGILLCGAETDLCDRAIKAGLKIKYVASTYAQHQVSKERCEFKYAMKRVFYAGVTRRYRGGLPSPNQKKKNIYDFLYAPIIGAAYLSGYATQKMVFEKHQIHKTPSERIQKT